MKPLWEILGVFGFPLYGDKEGVAISSSSMAETFSCPPTSVFAFNLELP